MGEEIISGGVQNRRPRRRIIVVVVCTLVCVGVAALLWYILDQRMRSVELQSGTIIVTRGQYDTMINQAKKHGVAESDARAMLIKSVRAQDAAAQLGIRSSDYQDAAVLAAITTFNLAPDAIPNEYEIGSQYPAGINTFLTYAEQGGYRFATFKFPFSRYISSAGLRAQTEDQKKKAGSLEDIRADVTYAQKQAQTFHDQLKNNKIPAERIIQTIRNDERLSYGYSNNDSQIMTVGANSSRQLSSGVTMQYNQELTKQLAELAIGTVSDIHDEVGSLDGSIDPPAELKVGEYQVKIGYIFTKLLDKREPSPGLTVRYSTKLREVNRE